MGVNTVFIAICSILQAFWIDKPVDEDGSRVSPEKRWVSGITV
jgi:hypothetical protein